MLTMFATMAQFEREVMLERRRIGIDRHCQGQGRSLVQRSETDSACEGSRGVALKAQKVRARIRSARSNAT
jgi:hypothetical protein